MTTTSTKTLQSPLGNRPLEPRSTGWSVADLEDPRLSAEWESGRYEIIEGVLAEMAPAYLYGGRALKRLTRIVETYLATFGTDDEFVEELEIVMGELRVLRPDAVLVTGDFEDGQIVAATDAGHDDPNKARIFVPPKLIIESVSLGHERHDTVLKMRWYAEFGVPNYWILEAFARTLACYRLENGRYVLDCEGRDIDELKPTSFPLLVIPLKAVWRPLRRTQQ